MDKSGITPREVSTALREALALMNDEGKHWIKGHYKRTSYIGKKKENSYCSVGAIEEVAYKKYPRSYTKQDILCDQLHIALRQEIGEKTSVETWNDRQKTTWQDVQKVFRKAADRMRKRKTLLSER